MSAVGQWLDSLALEQYAQLFEDNRIALDVLPEEPVPRDSPLLKHPRAILTPHAAFYSLEAEKELRRKAARNIITWLATGKPEYIVTRGTRSP